MKQTYRILLVDDASATQKAVVQELLKMGLQFISERVNSKEDFLKALSTFDPDVIISDQFLCEFDAFSAMKILRERGMDIPFLLSASGMTEEEALDYLRWGAYDYVLKDDLLRLPFAVKNALSKRALALEKKNIESLQLHLQQRFQATAGMN